MPPYKRDALDRLSVSGLLCAFVEDRPIVGTMKQAYNYSLSMSKLSQSAALSLASAMFGPDTRSKRPNKNCYQNLPKSLILKINSTDDIFAETGLSWVHSNFKKSCFCQFMLLHWPLNRRNPKEKYVQFILKTIQFEFCHCSFWIACLRTTLTERNELLMALVSTHSL